MRALIITLTVLTAIASAYLLARDWVRRHPQDVPWTALDLAHPTGRFTRDKLIELGEDPRQCRALLASAGSDDLPAPKVSASADCGYDDGMRLARDTGFAPAGLITSCPVAAALWLWEERVLQPAAMRHFGQRIGGVDHAGSYSCRRLYGRADGPFSEHATADAVDIVGFRLADGRSISVLRDWSGETPQAAFLRQVRTGACDYFATVLSPDYNAAHRDHLHLDQANRRHGGWHMCR